MTRPALSLFVALAAAMVPAADPPKPKANKLAGESSPYLLQHAHNPVDWHPWGADTFAKAKKEGKLVFLSIGYSSCHWCHVMEKESFSDEAIAKTLNENFVCIKVDREERPDIDDVYLTAVGIAGGGGGWPLTAFLTPDAKPIFGGTYFPPKDKEVDGGTIQGLPTVLKRVMDLHKDKKDDLYAQADRIAELTEKAMTQATVGKALVELNAELVAGAAEAFEFDPDNGGLGRKRAEYKGAKFPRVSAILFLLKQSAKPKQEQLAKDVARTLDGMARGGLYDHLGGGFHRYSTERTWTVPHFEKMLYDQAQLVELYCEAIKQKPNAEYERAVRETLAFVARELTSPDGYFYSALDADSEGVEGKFYVWTAKELDAALKGEADADLFRAAYALDGKPNFEDKHYILREPKALADVAKDKKLTEDELLKKFAPLKQKLFDLRAKRPRPFLDTKLITAWNGQMIAAYALAGQVLKEPKYTAAAEKAADFILKTMTDKDGRLLRIYMAKPGEKATAKGMGFLDDHAFLVHGLLSLAEATGDAKWVKKAHPFVTIQRQKFFADGGGFYNTPKDGEKLFARGKDSFDGAQPSANGMSVRNFFRLWRMTGDEGNRQEFERDLRAQAAVLKVEPTAVPQALLALDAALPLGGLKDLPTRMAEGVKNPKSSADVVKVQYNDGGLADGLETHYVGITVAKGWHVYANPVGNDKLVESATVIELRGDGKGLKHHELTYPKGEVKKGPLGDYRVYEGAMGFQIVVSHDDVKGKKMTARVTLVACNDKECLAPATVTVEMK